MAKILIIEDDLDIANLEKDYLEINNYEVSIVSDGLQGLQEAQTNRYDLIIIDVMLPTLNGFEICKIIRENLNIPLIILSARSDDIDKVRGLGLGADDYMTKPFSPSELVARVRNQLARYKRLLGHPKNDKIIEINGIRINQEARRVWVNNKEVNFTTTEFDLLLFFALHPNIVHSKSILFDRIWGVDDYGDIATVAVHVQKIRKKIEKDSSNPKIIETIWGAGYRFNRY